MKKSLWLALFCSVFYWVGLQAQPPESFKYQTIIRDENGDPIDDTVSFKMSILETTSTGTVVYSDTHYIITNADGLATLNIGQGYVISGTFEDIDWGGDQHFLKVELDTAGGSNYTHMGTSELLSVPYSMYSKESKGLDGFYVVDLHSDLEDLDLPVGTKVMTKGYYSIGDGGEGMYYLSSSGLASYRSGNDDSVAVVETQNGFAILYDWDDVRTFGTKGDGTTDDTESIEKCIEFTGEHGLIQFAKPSSYYKITRSLEIMNGQVWKGTGKEGCIIKSDMTSALVKLGDGGTTTVRDMAFRDLHLENLGGTCLYSRYASNWTVDNCVIAGRDNGHGVDSEQSYRIGFYTSRILSSGGYAAYLFNNSNVISFYNCQMTGGSAGGVAKVGESYNVAFDNCVFETTKYGIDLGSSGGVCHNVAVRNCSFENYQEAIKMGYTFAIIGADITNNFFSNVNCTYTSDVCMQLGRVRGALIQSNTFSLDEDEHAYEFKYNSAAVDYLKNSEITNNIYSVVDSMYRFESFTSDNAHFFLAQNRELQFDEETAYAKTREYVSPLITDNAGLANFLVADTSDFGGRILAVEIINCSGALDGTLRLGYVANQSYNMTQSLSGKSITQGQIDLYDDVSVYNIRSNQMFTMRYVAGTSGNTFRVRIRYKY